MTRRPRSARGIASLVAIAALVGVVAIPTFAASPAVPPSGGPAAEASATAESSGKPEKSGKPTKPGKADKAARVPAVEVTVSGTVGTRTTADGTTEYTLTTGSTTLVLDAGPPWFWGDKHPLAGFVGKRVTVAGGQREGSAEVDVRSVDGRVIREPGKPPWAGGWKRVGERHPGWTQEKWDRWQTRRAEHLQRHGVDCWPPGQCKDKPAKDKPAASAAPAS